MIKLYDVKLVDSYRNIFFIPFSLFPKIGTVLKIRLSGSKNRKSVIVTKG